MPVFSKMDEFTEKFQTAVDPPFLIKKNANFPENSWPKFPFCDTENQQQIFLDQKQLPRPPYPDFPRKFINFRWYGHP